MRTRLIIGPFIVLAVLGFFWVDATWLSEGRPATSGLVALLAALGWWEFSGMAGLGSGGERASKSLRGFGLLAVLFFHGAAWYSARVSTSLPFETLAVYGMGGTVLGAFSLVVFRREFLRQYRGVHETIIGVLLLGFLFSHVLRIYQGEPGGLEDRGPLLHGRQGDRHRRLPGGAGDRPSSIFAREPQEEPGGVFRGPRLGRAVVFAGAALAGTRPFWVVGGYPLWDNSCGGRPDRGLQHQSAWPSPITIRGGAGRRARR